ncbi:MAG: ATP-dependent zinc protease family protein [Candidatus Saccharimonadales bacterium]
MDKDTKVIGSTVTISFPAGNVYDLPAKVDTGADGSSIWASNIVEANGELSFCLLDKSSDKFSGKVIKSKDYKQIAVNNSFGDRETRYKVGLTVIIEGKRVRAKFTLANRKLKSYPALIGKRLLNNRFIVDVSKTN